MIWIGQHIYDLASRFRSDVYLENISTGTIASGAHLGLDSNNKIVKAADGGGDLTSIIAGTGLSGTDLTGPIPTLNVDAAQTGITSLGTLSSLAVTSASDLGSSAITLTNADVDQIALDINASNTTANVIDINAMQLTTGSAIKVQGNDQSNESVVLVFVGDGETVSSPSTARALIEAEVIKTGVVASTESRLIYGVRSTISDTATNHANSAVVLTAFTGTVDSASTSGHNYNTGLDLSVTDATYNTGISLLVENGGDDIVMKSSVDTGDLCTIATTTHGATKITTIDDDLAAAHFEIEADGDITLDAAGDITLDAVGTISLESDAISFLSPNANDPILQIKNTANDATSGRLRFISARGADGQDGDSVGRITFFGYDDGTPDAQQYAEIQTTIHDATNNQESGNMAFKVAAHDGGLEDGLVLTGGSVDAEVDVTIANGAASVTTVSGTLTMGSTATINNSGVVQVAAQTVIDHDQLANFTADEHFTQANITTVGTIGTGEWRGTAINTTYLDGQSGTNTGDETLASINALDITEVGTIDNGVWNGTAIATDYLKHKSTFELAGYAVADGTNYMMADIMSGNKAPFLHDETSIGANGTTADNPAAFLRAAGTVMPYDGTLKIWKGWGASSGTPTVDIGIFKYSPTADDATSDSLVLVKNTQITGAGNDNLKAFSETSFLVTVTAGDILITAIKGSVIDETAYFTSTVEIEWTS